MAMGKGLMISDISFGSRERLQCIGFGNHQKVFYSIACVQLGRLKGEIPLIYYTKYSGNELISKISPSILQLPNQCIVTFSCFKEMFKSLNHRIIFHQLFLIMIHSHSFCCDHFIFFTSCGDLGICQIILYAIIKFYREK
jgi:hypothetical protein